MGDGDLLKGVTRKRRLAGQRLIEHTRQRVDVGARVGRAALEPLGCHVGPGPDGRAGARQAGLPGGVRDPEIDQIRKVVVVEQNVGRLDIPMHQPDLVRGVQRRRPPAR